MPKIQYFTFISVEYFNAGEPNYPKVFFPQFNLKSGIYSTLENSLFS